MHRNAVLEAENLNFFKVLIRYPPEDTEVLFQTIFDYKKSTDCFLLLF